MMLHIDRHATISGCQDERWHDLIVILADVQPARSITRSLRRRRRPAQSMASLRAVIELKEAVLLAVFGPWSPLLVDVQDRSQGRLPASRRR